MAQHFQDQTVRPWEAFGTIDGVIEDTIFERCHIKGPAVLFLADSTFRGRTVVEGGPGDAVQNVVWEIVEGRQIPMGVVGVRRCTFIECTFGGIGFALRTDDIPGFWASITNEPDTLED